MLTVVSQDINDRRGTVVVEAPTMHEVLSSAARSLAIKTAAAAGLSRPGTSGNENAYPVDHAGACGEDVQRGQVPVSAYRCDYIVTGGL